MEHTARKESPKLREDREIAFARLSLPETFAKWKHIKERSCCVTQTNVVVTASLLEMTIGSTFS